MEGKKNATLTAEKIEIFSLEKKTQVDFRHLCANRHFRCRRLLGREVKTVAGRNESFIESYSLSRERERDSRSNPSPSVAYQGSQGQAISFFFLFLLSRFFSIKKSKTCSCSSTMSNLKMLLFLKLQQEETRRNAD